MSFWHFSKYSCNDYNIPRSSVWVRYKHIWGCFYFLPLKGFNSFTNILFLLVFIKPFLLSGLILLFFGAIPVYSWSHEYYWLLRTHSFASVLDTTCFLYLYAVLVRWRIIWLYCIYNVYFYGECHGQ